MNYKELEQKQLRIERALIRTIKEAQTQTKEVNKNEYGRRGFKPYDYFKEILEKD